jgi:hypothetical protein
MAIEWESSRAMPFFRNVSPSVLWIEVSVDQTLGGGPGTTVGVFDSGHAGDPERLLGMRVISLSQGYSAGNEALVHFGLGDFTEVDIVVTPPPPFGADPIVLEAQPADQHLRLPGGCP